MNFLALIISLLLLRFIPITRWHQKMVAQSQFINWIKRFMPESLYASPWIGWGVACLLTALIYCLVLSILYHALFGLLALALIVVTLLAGLDTCWYLRPHSVTQQFN